MPTEGFIALGVREHLRGYPCRQRFRATTTTSVSARAPATYPNHSWAEEGTQQEQERSHTRRCCPQRGWMLWVWVAAAGLAPGQALGRPETRPCSGRGSQLPARYHLWGIFRALNTGLSHLNVTSVSPVLAEFGAQQFQGAGSSCPEADIAYQHLGSLGGRASELPLSCYPKASVWERKKCPAPCSWFLGHQN